ncbi:DUF5641 domain-containing protein [Trichonephila clavipes]|nr:DUF5641 domain-containing protein [Trichonephila clavipes]
MTKKILFVISRIGPLLKKNSTSKIRPVFDAYARTKGSPSLNDCLEKGSNFIDVIPTILNRFRKYKFGVISDIEKAFLQIGVREQDRDFLRFMWYDRENRDHIKIYRHHCVVFGVTSSPFLLGATLNHHLDNARGNFDNVAKILRKSFYVDNCVISFETEEHLQKFIVESKILLYFNLRGWQSNVLSNPEKFSELESQPDNFETMVLGLIWNFKHDCLSCNINCQKNEGNLEIKIKKWDENLLEDILNQVKKWLEQLPILAGQLREQTQHHRKSRPVVVVENSLRNRTLWSLARIIQLIPGKDGHVRIARVKTEIGELVRLVQRLYNLELQEPEINLPKDLTDSVIRTRRGRKVISPKRLTYA